MKNELREVEKHWLLELLLCETMTDLKVVTERLILSMDSEDIEYVNEKVAEIKQKRSKAK
jgi:hypothetical protein